MPRPKSDPDREERITMEIVVDAYGSEERSMAWYYYLEEQLTVPFEAEVCKRSP
ncbi:calcium-binding protein, partial [Cupriavidus numazuensis]